MKFLKKTISALLAAVTAVAMLLSGSVTAGARTVEKKDGTTTIWYDSDDWYVVYYPSTAWVRSSGGGMSVSLSKRVLEIHMPNSLYESADREISKGRAFEIDAGTDKNNFFFCTFYPEDGKVYWSANFYIDDVSCEPRCFSELRTTVEAIDEDYSERVISLLLNDDCPDSVIQCLESEFQSKDFYLTAATYENHGDNLVYHFYNEKISYSVRNNGSSRLDGAGKSLSSLSASVKDQTYTGKARTPDVTITDGSKTLKKGTDYTLTYKNNKAIGTATVTVTGKGNYTGTKTLTFQIVPKKTTLTAKKSGEKITLSWDSVKGAEKYQIYYREKGETKYKKLATVSGNKTSYSTSKLDKNKTYQFKIRSYAAADGEKVYGKFSKVVTVK